MTETISQIDGLRTRLTLPDTIVKRDGRVMPFDISLIENALERCFDSFGRTPETPIVELARRVVNIIVAKGATITVENVQDIVEMVLQAAGEFEAAKRYILYRADHARKREQRPVPAKVRRAFAESSQYFPTQLQQFQFFDKYSRFNYGLGRRETWVETVDRAVGFLHELAGPSLEAETYERLRRGILEMRVMPSMRLLAMAGDAARRSNVTIYNCSYQPVESIDSFVEALIISMSGCGVGFSVEREYIENFPRVRRQTGKLAPTYVVPDSAEGWSDALRVGLQTWFDGGDVQFDLSQLRSAGAPLRTKGGRASGPEPLRGMLEFVRSRILGRQGSFLRSIDAHDIMCIVGNAAVSGGVRRTAMISLFDYDDLDMRHAKDGDFERENSQRWNANNSAVWPEGGLSQIEVAQQVLDMVQSGRGEPGIFNRQAALDMRPERRQAARFGTNPCVTGDTWVAIADGRGRARMLDLVQEGKDVDVYTMKGGETVIRTMRNPRKTGTAAPIYKVTFTDGSYMRVTPNHKFVLTDGTEKEAVSLEPNDGLESLTVFSYKKAELPKTAKVDYDAPKSYRMLQRGRFRRSEHRFIYKHHTGIELVGIDRQLHHVDFNSLNNSIGNLRLVTAEEHAHIHRDRMVGTNNPTHRIAKDARRNLKWRQNLSKACAGLVNGNAKDLTNEQLEQHLVQFVIGFGRVPTVSQYYDYAVQHNLPLSFSSYRKQYFGGGVVYALQAIAAKVGAMSTFEAEARKVTDLPVVFNNGLTYVIRNCEICGQEFTVRLSRREQATCSNACSQKLYYRNNPDTTTRGQAISEARTRNHDELRKQQIRVYNDLLFELERHPMKDEWMARCQQQGISNEISRVSSPFRFWKELQSQAMATNHRVLSVEPDGYEDVYTGTVDDTHTYFAIGSERTDLDGKVAMAYVLNRQCGEIILKPWQFCNLSAAVARQDDTFETLKEKVELATIIGSIQSMATHFPGLRPMWQQNCVEERLLGVDINGQLDSPVAQDARVQAQLREVAISTNRDFAAKLGINQSVAVTCVKPSGNSSQLLDSSSGLHARWAKYYIRNVRVATHSPIFKVLQDAGVPMDPENGQTRDNANTWVIHFPVKAPEGAITRNGRSAIEQCNYWLQNKVNWTDHNPSVTITYRPDEVLDILSWIWEHRGQLGGMAFLPTFDAQYAQLPYIEITEDEYNKLAPHFPVVDYSKIWRHESEDYTKAAQELACSSGSCEIDTL